MFLRDLLSRLCLVDPPDDPPERPTVFAGTASAPAAPGAEVASVLWPAARLAVTDALWGEGFLQPGGAEETLLLAKPLGLTAAHSMLLIGAESGGPPRCLAGGLGSWISAYETDPDLVAVAARRCTVAGFGKRAAVAPWSPLRPEFPERYFHRALALDPVRAAKPDCVLPAILKAVKADGELVMTAVASGPAMASSRLDEWLAAEARPHPPSTERDLCRLLGALGHEVRVAKDITTEHVESALRQWHGFVEGLGPMRPEPARARLIVREAETWVRRARLMRAGAIRLLRFHSIGRGA